MKNCHFQNVFAFVLDAMKKNWCPMKPAELFLLKDFHIAFQLPKTHMVFYPELFFLYFVLFLCIFVLACFLSLSCLLTFFLIVCFDDLCMLRCFWDCLLLFRCLEEKSFVGSC